MKSALLWLLPVLLLGAAGFWLTGRAGSGASGVRGGQPSVPDPTVQEPTSVEVQNVSEVPQAELQRQVWFHPSTDERVTFSFDGKVTRVTRGGQVRVFAARAVDVAAAREQTRQMALLDWDARSLTFLREMARAGNVRDASGRSLTLDALGFPPELWAEVDAHEKAVRDAGPGTWNPGLGVPAGGLIDHPRPGWVERYADLMAASVEISPADPEVSLTEQAQALQKEGFARVTARREDGSLWLPALLESRRNDLQTSERPVVRLVPAPAQQAAPWESKVGGVPYRLKGTPWPMTLERRPRPLVFLAQLNLGDLNTDGTALPDFPRAGLLQFFIVNADFHGANLDAQPRMTGWADGVGFRVQYVPDVVQDRTRLDTKVPQTVPDPDGIMLDDENLPFRFPLKETALAAVPDREPVSGADTTAWTMFPGAHTGTGPAWDTLGAVYALSPGGHKAGGFPDFTQADPRPRPDEWPLLFQLDSDDRLGVMWGDVGTANFFIRPDDLKRRDFSRVAFNWDSG